MGNTTTVKAGRTAHKRTGHDGRAPKKKSDGVDFDAI
jgi:hypothetical protein